jgi:1-acyl-sn-glycerol-3-phosphate acyltransferase
MSLVGRILLALWGFLWAGVWTVVVGVGFLVGSLFFRGPGWTNLVQRFFSWILLLGVGIRVRVEGEENIPAGSSCVVMGNHRSYLDIPAVVLALHRLPILFVAKRELKRIPFFGWALAASAHIKVDRGDREQAIRALEEAMARLGSGIGLVIFPEGTRSRTHRLLPFKKGGFYAAVDGRFPILPVSIRNSGHLWGKMSLLPRSGIISVQVHAPVTTEALTRRDIPDLMQEVRDRLLSALPESAPLETEAGAGAEGGRRRPGVGEPPKEDRHPAEEKSSKEGS